MSSTDRAGNRSTIETPVFADGEALLHGMQEIVGRKWHPVILYRLLEDGPTGFSDLKRRVDGISSKMLSESLTTLEAAAVVDRTQVNDRPVRVEYTLTDRGQRLEPVIAEMIHWGSTYQRERTGDEPK